MSGSSGFIGTALSAFLRSAGHQVVPLVRRSQQTPGVISWDPEGGTLDATLVRDFAAIIHLAGENIAARRWSERQKRRIRESRILSTRMLSQCLAGLSSRPSVFICASAIGYYGDRGEEILREDSPQGKGFLAEVCGEWERATLPASEKGIRVITPRIGTVLGSQGGALAKMLPAFRLGLGGPIGDGKQYMSWISLKDVCAALTHCLSGGSVQGPVNLAAPEPVTNRDFARALGRILGKPAVLPLPSLILKTILGEMAQELLLSSARVEPAKLMGSGYAFKHPTLESALQDALMKK